MILKIYGIMKTVNVATLGLNEQIVSGCHIHFKGPYKKL